MASIISKRKGKQRYYYVVTSKRVNGKPRIVKQVYLGTVKRILKLLESKLAPIPLEGTPLHFGLPMALWQAARRSGAFDALLSVWPAPRKGPSIPHYLLLAAMHRVCAPGPKTQVADWYRSTVLPSLWDFPPERFSSQAFWNHFDAIHVDGSASDQLAQAQQALLGALRERDLVGERVLAYDTTNFHTWIDTANDRCQLPQRGHNKQKRRDLRQVGLAYAMDARRGLGLCHHVYPGNTGDAREFPEALERITRMLDGAAVPRKHITLVCDKGSCSAANMAEMDRQGVGWVQALPWDQAPKSVRDLARDDLQPAGGEHPGVATAARKVEMYGHPRLAVLRRSDPFATAQFHSVANSLHKAQRQLKALARQLRKPGCRRKEPSIRKRLQAIRSPQYLAQVLSCDLQPQGQGWRLDWKTDSDALMRLHSERFGRTVLLTSRMDWTAQRVLDAYAGQERIERVFRGLKAGDWLRWGPMYHWTDSKIRVHAFCCMLGISLLWWLHRQSDDVWPGLTLEELKQELNAIHRIDLVYPPFEGKGNPRLVQLISSKTLAQAALADALGLDGKEGEAQQG